MSYARVQVIESALTERYGPLLSGRPLWQTLGYPSGQALRRAASRGVLPVPTFRLEHRRGLFAYTTDVARWLANASSAEQG